MDCGSALDPRSKKQIALLIGIWASIALAVSLGAMLIIARIRQPSPQDVPSVTQNGKDVTKLAKARRYANLLLDEMDLGDSLTKSCVSSQVAGGKIRAADAAELTALVQPIFAKLAGDGELRESFAQIFFSSLSEDELDTLITFVGSPNGTRLWKAYSNGRRLNPAFVEEDLRVFTQKPVSEAWRKFGEVVLDKRYRESTKSAFKKYQVEVDEKIAFVSRKNLKN